MPASLLATVYSSNTATITRLVVNSVSSYGLKDNYEKLVESVKNLLFFDYATNPGSSITHTCCSIKDAQNKSDYFMLAKSNHTCFEHP